jgi:hypothetical protein
MPCNRCQSKVVGIMAPETVLVRTKVKVLIWL